MNIVKKIARGLTAGVASLGLTSGLGLTGGLGLMTGIAVVASATPAAACGPDTYIGEICTFSFDWCPRDFLPADGRQVNLREYQALFALIGFKYGGDNVNVFNLPDLRGRSVIGQGQGPGLININLAQKVGQQQLTLNMSQVPLIPHTHLAVFSPTGGGSQTIKIPANAGSLGITAKLQGTSASGQNTITNDAYLGQGQTGPLQAPIYVPSGSVGTKFDLSGLEAKLTGEAGNGPINFTVNTGITGGNVTVAASAPIYPSTPVSTQSPGLGMTACIATNGLYPSRP
ncbi:tail fiber protein [Allorhizobium sp. BGMRC 0089]|uniref:phage tail protein n=1 Tax=Allorhizobium sonneratiae TaxID=2934936 RepID=UPI002034268B|nr:tail fiber protein [Allorhizobium sonneratiae]MCM2294146.1 tail fiber protein [Allorhizobium sonneratiae]